jgi:hypothetical protein
LTTPVTSTVCFDCDVASSFARSLAVEPTALPTVTFSFSMVTGENFSALAFTE